MHPSARAKQRAEQRATEARSLLGHLDAIGFHTSVSVEGVDPVTLKIQVAGLTADRATRIRAALSACETRLVIVDADPRPEPAQPSPPAGH